MDMLLLCIFLFFMADLSQLYVDMLPSVGKSVRF